MRNLEITKLFLESVKDDADFKEAVDLVKKNSNGGNFWLIGSFLYQNIAAELYGLEKQKAKDIDFIIENPADKIVFSDNWEEKSSGFQQSEIYKKRRLDCGFCSA